MDVKYYQFAEMTLQLQPWKLDGKPVEYGVPRVFRQCRLLAREKRDLLRQNALQGFQVVCQFEINLQRSYVYI